MASHRRQNPLVGSFSGDRVGNSVEPGTSLGSARGPLSKSHGHSSQQADLAAHRNLMQELQSRLMNTQTEGMAIAALAFVHSKATTRETKPAVAQLFMDPSIPDLVFGICRRFPACISFVSSIMVLCVDVSDFAKKSLRNRTVVAFLRFLVSNESLANAFEQLICASVHSLKSFAASEGEKVLTDVMNQLRAKCRSVTIVSLMKIVARLITEPANSTQERTNLLASFLLLFSDGDIVNVIGEGLKNDSSNNNIFVDSLLAILKTAGQIDMLTIPVDVACLTAQLLMEDGCRAGAEEDAKIAEWDAITTRLITTMASFPTTDARRQSSFVPKLWQTASSGASRLSSMLTTQLLQFAITWMQKGWMTPEVLHIANAAFSHELAAAEQRSAVVVMLHSCAFRNVHATLATLNIPAIRKVFTWYVLDATPESLTTSPEARTICEYWIGFVHMATYLKLAHVQEFFRPLSVHIASDKIKEKTFTELTRWPRNDANDERKLAQCEWNLNMLKQLESEEQQNRRQFDVVFEHIANYYVEFRQTLAHLEQDPRFVQKIREWNLAVHDDQNLFTEKYRTIESTKRDLIRFFDEKVCDIKKNFHENTTAEKNAHTNEVDGIVWDADEMATKVLAHTNRLAFIETAHEKETQNVKALSSWRLAICDQILGSLKKIEAQRPRRLLNLEKEEERTRGSAVVSSQEWAVLRHDHDEERESLLDREATERRALWSTPVAALLEAFAEARRQIASLELLHNAKRLGLEEDRGREFIDLTRTFYMDRPDLPTLARNFKVGSRSPSRTPVGKSLSPRGVGGSNENGVRLSSPTNPAGRQRCESPEATNSNIDSAVNYNNAANKTSNGNLSPNNIGFTRGNSPRVPDVLVLSPRTCGIIVNHEAESRAQLTGREHAWRRYYVETFEVSCRKAIYQYRLDGYQQIQLAMREDHERFIIIEKEWVATYSQLMQHAVALLSATTNSAANLMSNHLMNSNNNLGVTAVASNIQQLQQGQGLGMSIMPRPLLDRSANVLGGTVGGFEASAAKSGVLGAAATGSLYFAQASMLGSNVTPPPLQQQTGSSLPAVLHTSNIYATSSGVFAPGAVNSGATANNSSSPATTLNATSLDIAAVRELKPVTGYVTKAIAKYRANEIQDMERHRRARIIALYKIFMNEVYSQMTLFLFKTRVQWVCMDEETYARYNEACREQLAFNAIIEYKAYEEHFTLPMRHIHEIERQIRSQIQMDERIEYCQMQAHRPRGRRFRPLREVDPDMPRHSTEPGLASRVKGWLRDGKNMSAQNPIPCFSEVFPSIVHVLSSELRLPPPPPKNAIGFGRGEDNSSAGLTSTNKTILSGNFAVGGSSYNGQNPFNVNNPAASPNAGNVISDTSIIMVDKESVAVTAGSPLLKDRERENDASTSHHASSNARSNLQGNRQSSPELSRGGGVGNGGGAYGPVTGAGAYSNSDAAMHLSMQANSLVNLYSTSGSPDMGAGGVPATSASAGGGVGSAAAHRDTTANQLKIVAPVVNSIAGSLPASPTGADNRQSGANRSISPFTPIPSTSTGPMAAVAEEAAAISAAVAANGQLSVAASNNLVKDGNVGISEQSHVVANNINVSPTATFASKLRNEISFSAKNQRSTMILLKALDKLEFARRSEVSRCEETTRETIQCHYLRMVAHRHARATDDRDVGLSGAKVRLKDSRIIRSSSNK